MATRWGYVAGIMLIVVAAASARWWLPATRSAVAQLGNDHPARAESHGHDHGDPDHAAGNPESIELTPSGLKNIGYSPVTVSLSTFERELTLQGMVVERPGRSQIQITAPMTGTLTAIHAAEGAVVEFGAPMFEIRLTHEELVAAQTSFLKTVEALEVVNREIERLKSVSEGVVAGRRILEQEYEKQKFEAALRAERQALLLHGLKEQQIDAIQKTRQLFHSQVISAPEHPIETEEHTQEHLLHVQQMPVKPGQQVETGQVLCVLADHCELFIEGRAFEDDGDHLRAAVREGWNIDATLLAGRRETETVPGLKLLYLSDQVDTETRAFRFYLRLSNQIVLDQKSGNGRRYVAWRFKPGQRMELRIPIERWEQRIVLPVSAVVEEGAESYVYRQSGDHFERVPVHVEYRDQASAVIANDGSIFPGDLLAARGAYQMHLALKSRTGGGVDPHAGHSH